MRGGSLGGSEAGPAGSSASGDTVFFFSVIFLRDACDCPRDGEPGVASLAVLIDATDVADRGDEVWWRSGTTMPGSEGRLMPGRPWGGGAGLVERPDCEMESSVGLCECESACK